MYAVQGCGVFTFFFQLEFWVGTEYMVIENTWREFPTPYSRIRALAMTRSLIVCKMRQPHFKRKLFLLNKCVGLLYLLWAEGDLHP